MSLEQELADFFNNGQEYYPLLNEQEIAAVQLGTMIAVASMRMELSVLVIQFPSILEEILREPAKLLSEEDKLPIIERHRELGDSRDWLRIGMAGAVTAFIQAKINQAARIN